MRPLCRLIVSTFLIAGSAVAASANTLAIVAPQGGPYEALGFQIRAGARMAAEAAGVAFVEINETCEEGSGGAIGEGLAAAQVYAAVGFLCTETLAGAMPALKNAGITAYTLSSRSGIVMEDALRNGWPLFRLGPSAAHETDILTDTILRDWQNRPFAMIEDGTVYNRELTDRIRNRLEERGLKPLFVDTFRPGQEQQIALVRRLRRTGVTQVFAGGDRSDIAIIARDAAAENIPLTILGGDAMNAANTPVALQKGVFAVTLPDYSAKPEAKQAVEKLSAAGIVAEGYVLPAWAAVEVAIRAAADAASQKKPVPDILVSTTLPTVLGPISFTATHELSANPFVLQQWNGSVFQAAGAARND